MNVSHLAYLLAAKAHSDLVSKMSTAESKIAVDLITKDFAIYFDGKK